MTTYSLRVHQWALGLLCLGAAIAVGGCANPNYIEGVNKANDEIRSGTACIYSTSMAERGHTDPRTGLPYFVLEDPETPEMLSMIEGHNQTIRAHYKNTENESPK